jgi:antitoxin (DNA-binding transcriptional repressor) of toxin-antitoxin stability system
MLEFRQDAEGVIRRLRSGERLLLTYRGKPVARLEPLEAEVAAADDPIYSLYQLADDETEPLTNDEIDALIYDT